MQLSRLFALRDFFSLLYSVILVMEEMSLCSAKTLNGFVVVVFDSGFSLFSRLLVYFWPEKGTARATSQYFLEIICRVGSFIFGQWERLIFIGVVRRQFALVWIDRHAHWGRWHEMVCDASSIKMHGDKFGEKKCICFSSSSKAFSSKPFWVLK